MTPWTFNLVAEAAGKTLQYRRHFGFKGAEWPSVLALGK